MVSTRGVSTDDLTPQQKLYSAYGESEVVLSTGAETGRPRETEKPMYWKQEARPIEK